MDEAQSAQPDSVNVEPAGGNEQLPLEETPKKRKRSIIKIKKRFKAGYSIVAMALGIILLCTIAIFIFRELTNDGFVIQQINVPESFEKSGYTGAVVAERISDQLNHVIRTTRMARVATSYKDAAAESDLTVDMVGFGVPVRAAIDLVGTAIGINYKKKVRVSITIEGTNIVMLIHVGSEIPERMEFPDDPDIGIPIKSTVNAAAEAILKYSNKDILSIYYSNILRDPGKMISHSKFVLEQHENNHNPEIEAEAYGHWAFGLILEKKYTAAEKKIKEGLKLFPDNYKLYRAWGLLYRRTNNFPNALARHKKSLALIGKNVPEFEQVTGFNNIAGIYIRLKDYDSAKIILNEGLKLDNKSPLLHYNLASIALNQQDTVTCLEHLEKSMAYGIPVNQVISDPEYQPMLEHPRLKNLIEKFTE